jgi:nitrate/nitrite transporter NarK
MGWFPEHERGLALGVRQTAIPIGGATAAAGLPWLASSGGTRLAFLVLGCACIGGAVVAASLIRDSPSAVGEVEDITQPMRDPRAWILGLGTDFYLTAQIAITGFVGLFLHVHRGVSAHSQRRSSPGSTCSASAHASPRDDGRTAFTRASRRCG